MVGRSKGGVRGGVRPRGGGDGAAGAGAEQGRCPRAKGAARPQGARGRAARWRTGPRERAAGQHGCEAQEPRVRADGRGGAARGWDAEAGGVGQKSPASLSSRR